MKKLITILFVSATTVSFGQYFQPVKLKKGQMVSAVINMNTDADMGMGTTKTNMQMKHNFSVIDETEKTYILTSSLKSMKMDFDGMGQQMSFDSDKPEDKSSPIAQGLGDKLTAVDTFAVNKNNGTITMISKKKEDASGGMGMMNAGSESEPINEIFFVVPMSRKIGDSWQDSSRTESITTKKTYTLVSRDQNIATVKYTGVNFGTINSEVQGMQMTGTVDSKLSGELKVNMETGIVTSTTGDVDNNTAMDVMGQSMNINSKVKSSAVYTVQ